MSTDQQPRAPSEGYVSEWREDWEQRLAQVGPQQLAFDAGPSTTYWASPTHAPLWKALTNFGRWLVVVVDTFLVLIAALLCSAILLAIASFSVALHDPILQHGGAIGTALNDSSNTVTAWLASPVGTALAALATQAGIVLVIQMRVVQHYSLSWTMLGIGSSMRRAPWRAVGLGVAYGLAGFVVAQVMLSVMSYMGLDVQGQERAFQSVRHAPAAELLPFFVTTVFTAPLAEEAFFRAYALRALSVRYGLPAGLALSSALFAALHLGEGVGWEVLPLFVIGLILGWSYTRTGNLLTSITAHALNNAIGVVLLYSSR